MVYYSLLDTFSPTFFIGVPTKLPAVDSTVPRKRKLDMTLTSGAYFFSVHFATLTTNSFLPSGMGSLNDLAMYMFFFFHVQTFLLSPS